MDNLVCFIIESQILYLDQVLVEYNGVPIFFICKSKDERYLCLCSDIDELKYYVIRISAKDIFNLLHGKTSMRNTFLSQKAYWEIESGEDPTQDAVLKKSIEEINQKLLPDENAYYEILSPEIAEYVKNFDVKFLVEEYTKNVKTATDRIILHVRSNSIFSRRTTFVNISQKEFKLKQYDIKNNFEYSINKRDTACAA